MDDTIQRLEQLETSMREHTHSTLDSTSTLPKNKPVIQRVTTATTVTPRNEEDGVDITALASAVTIANPTGVPHNFQKLIIQIKDNGTAGTANTGGGAGAGYTGSGNAGGSGIVIIRYHTDGSDGVSTSSTGGTITTSGVWTIHTFTTSGTWTMVGTGGASQNSNFLGFMM